MKVTIIKRFSQKYYECFGYNGASLGETESQIQKGVNRHSEYRAFEDFVKDMNRYSSVPTPKMSECKYDLTNISFTQEDDGYRIYSVNVIITWDYIKE